MRNRKIVKLIRKTDSLTREQISPLVEEREREKEKARRERNHLLKFLGPRNIDDTTFPFPRIDSYGVRASIQTMLHVRFLRPRLHDSDWERLRKSAGFGGWRGRGRRGGSVIGGTLV